MKLELISRRKVELKILNRVQPEWRVISQRCAKCTGINFCNLHVSECCKIWIVIKRGPKGLTQMSGTLARKGTRAFSFAVHRRKCSFAACSRSRRCSVLLRRSNQWCTRLSFLCWNFLPEWKAHYRPLSQMTLFTRPAAAESVGWRSLKMNYCIRVYCHALPGTEINDFALFAHRNSVSLLTGKETRVYNDMK